MAEGETGKLLSSTTTASLLGYEAHAVASCCNCKGLTLFMYTVQLDVILVREHVRELMQSHGSHGSRTQGCELRTCCAKLLTNFFIAAAAAVTLCARKITSKLWSCCGGCCGSVGAKLLANICHCCCWRGCIIFLASLDKVDTSIKEVRIMII